MVYWTTNYSDSNSTQLTGWIVLLLLHADRVAVLAGSAGVDSGSGSAAGTPHHRPKGVFQVTQKQKTVDDMVLPQLFFILLNFSVCDNSVIAWWWTYFRTIIAPGNIQYVNFLINYYYYYLLLDYLQYKEDTSYIQATATYNWYNMNTIWNTKKTNKYWPYLQNLYFYSCSYRHTNWSLQK